MTGELDPRLARRRRQVQEASARRRLRWTISVLVLALLAGMVVALFQSSWFSVDSISVEGVRRAPVTTILEEAGIEPGVSIVSVRAGRAEDLLRANPWVAEADVKVVWPRSVEVVVLEYVPAARVKAGDGWIVASARGAVLAGSDNLADPLVKIDPGPQDPGSVISDPLVLGALEFVAALPEDLRPGVVVEARGSDLFATVDGHAVELGSASDMGQKAITLSVVLEGGVAAEAKINMISPMRPAVSNPEPVVETSQEVTTETTASS